VQRGLINSRVIRREKGRPNQQNQAEQCVQCEGSNQTFFLQAVHRLFSLGSVRKDTLPPRLAHTSVTWNTSSNGVALSARMKTARFGLDRETLANSCWTWARVSRRPSNK